MELAMPGAGGKLWAWHDAIIHPQEHYLKFELPMETNR
jgi:hypothetical protein